MRRAQQMRALARGLAGDPAALACGGRDLAVEGRRELQGDQRATLGEPREKSGVDFRRLGGEKAGLDCDAGGAQHGQTAPGDAGIGILDGHDDAGDPGGDQRIGAGRGLAVMAARLEADISSGTCGARAGAGQRLGLAMRPAAGLGPAAADDGAVLHDDAADRGVGPGRP